MIKKRLSIPDMHCTGCTIAVENAIERLPGIRSAEAHYAKQIADVEFDEAQVSAAEIVAAVERAGYAASVLER